MLNNKYFDMLQGNIDSFGVITQNAQANWDGGDTTQREGMFMCAMYYHYKAGRITYDQYNEMANRYIDIINKLQYENFWSLRRHPDKTKWYYEPNCMSRDQMVPNVAALGYWFNLDLLPMGLKSVLRGGLFTTNTRENGAYPSDNPSMSIWQKIGYVFGAYNPGVPCYQWKLPDLTDPSVWGSFIRGLRLWPAYPMLIVSDLILLANSLILYYETKQGAASNDQNTHQMLMLQAHQSMPTPTSALAMWIYKKTNPQAALDSYFAPANNGPRMNDIYREIWASI